jgi:hypothetical protein
MSFLCDSIYFITVFLFGTVASVCFTGVPFNRKNILTLSVFCALDGILQIISFAVFGQEISRGLYPIVVHLPLVLFSLADIQMLMEHFDRQCLDCLYVLSDSSLVRTGDPLIF